MNSVADDDFIQWKMNQMDKQEKQEPNPKIEWEQGELYDTHDHERHYGAEGTSEDGRKWIGTWVVTDGEFSGIIDIEEE